MDKDFADLFDFNEEGLTEEEALEKKEKRTKLIKEMMANWDVTDPCTQLGLDKPDTTEQHAAAIDRSIIEQNCSKTTKSRASDQLAFQVQDKELAEFFKNWREPNLEDLKRPGRGTGLLGDIFGTEERAEGIDIPYELQRDYEGTEYDTCKWVKATTEELEDDAKFDSFERPGPSAQLMQDPNSYRHLSDYDNDLPSTSKSYAAERMDISRTLYPNVGICQNDPQFRDICEIFDIDLTSSIPPFNPDEADANAKAARAESWDPNDPIAPVLSSIRCLEVELKLILSTQEAKEEKEPELLHITDTIDEEFSRLEEAWKKKCDIYRKTGTIPKKPELLARRDAIREKTEACYMSGKGKQKPVIKPADENYPADNFTSMPKASGSLQDFELHLSEDEISHSSSSSSTPDQNDDDEPTILDIKFRFRKQAVIETIEEKNETPEQRDAGVGTTDFSGYGNVNRDIDFSERIVFDLPELSLEEDEDDTGSSHSAKSAKTI